MKPSENFSKKISIFSLLFLVVLGVFCYGVAVGSFKKWPYKQIEAMYSATLSILRYGQVIPANRLIEAPSNASRERFTVYQADKVEKGYYAFMGFDDQLGTYAAWLLDSNGQRIHTWDLTYEALDADGPLNGSVSPHAFKVLEDGSLIVSFDSGDVLARIDQCSQPMWTQPEVYHHSLERAHDGSFWGWRGENTSYGHYQYLANFDANTGKLIKEIGIVEDLLQARTDYNMVIGLAADFPFKKFDKTPSDRARYDLFHPNDIDVLQPEIADQFENFEAGDLLTSFRRLNLVAVIDPDTHELKWWATGPWKAQHDPDFTSDGKISIYNNNTYFGRSQILTIDPTTNEISDPLANGNLSFYSKTQGKHQYLPSGNLLIVMPDEGRAVQVTATGDLVFEHNNVSKITSTHNEHLANGIWFAEDYFTALPQCKNQ